MGTAERREREKEQRRNTIIDAAEKVFFTKSLESSTMDDVAAQAELSKGTLYLYFKSKEDLYLAIHLRGNRILTKMFKEAVQNFKSGLEKVRAIGRAYFKYYRKYPDYFNAMIYYESRPIDYNDENSIAMECQIEGKTTMQILIDAIKHGINDGSIRSDIDPLKTAITLWGQSTGIIQIAAVKNEMIQHNFQLTDTEIIEYSFDLIGQAIAR
jgi:TetR/AcrR family transcriptional regulator